MCGIVAILNKDRSRPVDAGILTRMTRRLEHRGPDDEGTFIDGEVGLGHRRLSVIDLEGGHQPMAGPSGATWIAYNGEIYNYRELRAELASLGVRLTTQSDTEVLVALYEIHGRRFLERVNGMFALLIWDQRDRSLLLARDRLGIKPLYCWDGPECLVVGSEIKAILAHPQVPRRLREPALGEYLMFRQLSGGRTMFADIDAVPPGSLQVRRGPEVDRRLFWDLAAAGARDTGDRRDREERLRFLLEDSVRLRLVADVPVGTFNSGGVDSSLITALATRHASGPMHTFAVGFAEKEYDERSYAKLVAERLGTIHHEIVGSPQAFRRQLESSIWHHDEPLNHANSVLIHLLSRFAKERVTVTLTGEGADELFGGYPRYLLIRVLRALRGWGGGPVGTLFRMLPGRKARWIASSAGRAPDYLVASNARYLLEGQVAGLCAEDPLTARLALLDGEDDPFGKLMQFEIRTYLHNVLQRMDRMSMAAGLEARVPFLDHRLVEFAAGIPLEDKMPRLQTKALVKAVARDLVPSEVVGRRKSGFGVPLSDWMRRDDALADLLEMLCEKKTRERGWWRAGALEQVVEAHRAGEDRSELLWGVAGCELWARTMLDGQGPSERPPAGVS